MMRFGLLVGAIALIALIFHAFQPVYVSKANFLALLRAMALNGIVAMGLTFVIVTRKFDLSLAGVASLSAMTLGFAMATTNSLEMTVLSALAIGLACGLISGAMVGYGRLPDVVTTIAVGSIAYGMAFAYNGGADYSKNFFSSGLVAMNFKTVLGVQMPVFIMIVTALACGYILHASRLGLALYATGENPVAARLSGVSTGRSHMLAFGICGMLVGLAMLLQVAGIGSSRVTAGGQILLPAYTSVYLGAALFGRPSIYSTLCGVVMMSMLLNGFTLLSVPYYYSDAVVSLILVLAIILFDPKFFERLAKLGALRANKEQTG